MRSVIRTVMLTTMIAILGTYRISAQVQQCPETANTTICQDQYNTCPADNEGKNCSPSTCQQYCADEFDACNYGVVQSDIVQYRIVSKTAEAAGPDGSCVMACTGGFWSCWQNPYYEGYDKYDTVYEQLHYKHRYCAGSGYEYDDVESYGTTEQDCYQYDYACRVYEDTYHGLAYETAECFIDQSGQYVQFSP